MNNIDLTKDDAFSEKSNALNILNEELKNYVKDDDFKNGIVFFDKNEVLANQSKEVKSNNSILKIAAIVLIIISLIIGIYFLIR